MTITIDQVGGVGMNALYRIKQDDRTVATIVRSGARHWCINSMHYGHRLASTVGIDNIKSVAQKLDYPSKRDVYELLCQAAEKQRRAYKERLHAHDLAKLTRELIAGSNSARSELEQLMVSIDAWIADRADTRQARFRQAEAHYEATGERIYTGGDPLYPEPPESQS